MFFDFVRFLNFRIDRRGYILVLSLAAVAFISSLFSVSVFCFIAVIMVAVALFFRDPKRVSSMEKGVVLSPSDGVIIDISDVDFAPGIGLSSEKFSKISIFLSLFDVHVNRIPISGVIESRAYQRGKFSAAFEGKASDDNEQLRLVIKAYDGERIACVQIAGFIARRIVCSAFQGDKVTMGERYGIICFGSRMEIYLPSSYVTRVLVGQRMVGGETILAEKLLYDKADRSVIVRG
ncbi:phosphatidylserine decarboxylase [Candidatus Hydrogenosomobacter endosymbioticus]|uniref:Phosphatidylserine decarboxylase proenzyme n=1 Tax=Candidatus Hydrogenosomobacter endosymbioticus TaxID=2558174 RepID=A0ABM7V8N0_9PROT|nr:phosphatidylserine decarboxylase [Candidatus Hydrogenosomobacter endosymbioticus]BDB96135.1 phosphatidylserine decarboxylase proenzyme [Candidatus Hydrogenosomobacter endosymbioticus]